MNTKLFIAHPGNAMEEATLAGQALYELGFENKVLLPFTIFDGVDTSNFTPEDFLKPMIREMLDCNTVLTIDGWDKDDVSSGLVTIARMLHLEISPAHEFVRRLSKKGDDIPRTAAENEDASASSETKQA